MQNQVGSQTMPPLTEKDLAYLKDQCVWELLASKKAYQYAHQTLEPECREVMFQVARAHQQNLERLSQHLAQHVNLALQHSVVGNQPTATVAQI